MKVLCVFGEHQYGDPARGTSTEYATFVPALKRLGHRVIHIDSWDKRCYNDYAELNQAILQTIETERPDVMLTVQKDYEIWLETLRVIQARGDVATISWTTDDSWKYSEVSRFIGSAYHAMTTTYENVVERYHQDGIENVLLTQWAASAEQLEAPMSFDECRYAVSFVGAAHGDRKEKIAALRERGIEVACFGHGWESGAIAAEEIPQIIRQSVISLNFSNAYKGAPQVKARTYEVPGAGGFLLTEAAEGLDRAYVPGKEIEVFHSIDELVDKINYFLIHPAERNAIALSGFLRTHREHTYDRRMAELLDFALQSHQRWIAANAAPEITPQVVEESLEQAVKKHKPQWHLGIVKRSLVFVCSLVWGPDLCFKAARRICFELSWRLAKHETFTAAGWVGRMFPYQ